jgi:hypothetical protein
MKKIFIFTLFLANYCYPMTTNVFFIPYDPSLMEPRTEEEQKAYEKHIKAKKETFEKLKKLKISSKSMRNLQKNFSDIPFSESKKIIDLIKAVARSEINLEKKLNFIIFFREHLEQIDLNSLNQIDDLNNFIDHQFLIKELFTKELDKKAKEDLEIIKNAQRQGKIERRKLNPLQDFFNEKVADIPEIRNRYYQKEEDSFVPFATTISDILDQIVNKMNDPNYESYRHLLRNAPQDLHRIISSHYSFSSKATDKVKEEKYFSEDLPIITEDVLQAELNERLKKYRKEKMKEEFDVSETNNTRPLSKPLFTAPCCKFPI